jgi:hypothetical protein
MSKFKPEEDGITHINIYSKGKTELGIFLSNFAFSEITTMDGNFASIEGYWYWLSCRDDNLRDMYGWKAKDYGREFGGRDWMDDSLFKLKIMAAITTKIAGNTKFIEQLKKSDLPFVHYYVYRNKIIEPKEGKWIWEHIENIRELLK